MQNLKKTEKNIPFQDKYITTSIKLSGEVFKEKFEEAKLATNKDVNTVEQSAIENKENIESNTFDLSFLLVKVIFIMMDGNIA